MSKVESLKTLGNKVNGITPDGDTVCEIINNIAEEYVAPSGDSTYLLNPTVDSNNNITDAATIAQLNEIAAKCHNYEFPNVVIRRVDEYTDKMVKSNDMELIGTQGVWISFLQLVEGSGGFGIEFAQITGNGQAWQIHPWGNIVV